MKKLFLGFSLIGLLGCAEEKVKAPAGLLPQTKLISIMADIHIAESRVEAMRISPDTAMVIFKRLQQDIYKKQNVSEAEFDKTYNFYLENVAELDKIYEGLVDTLGMREIKAPAVVIDTAKTVLTSDSAAKAKPLTDREEKLKKIAELREKRRLKAKK